MSTCCAPAARPAQPAATTQATATLPVAIIGAGPVGLAAAAHLLARGLTPVVLEAGATAAAAVRAWGHVRMFSPWRYNIDRAAHALLAQRGWTAPDPDALPTGHELAARYLDPLAALPELAPHLRLQTRVIAVSRAGLGKVRDAGRQAAPFELRLLAADGTESRLLARAVIDASGTFFQPGWAGASGLPALGETAAAPRIRYAMPDVLGAERARYAGRRVLVLGAGDSALGTLIDLAQLARAAPGTRIVWATRRADLSRSFGGGAADQLPARGALGTQVRALLAAGAIVPLHPFAVTDIATTPDGLVVTGTDGTAARVAVTDELIVCTGFRPDLALLAETRLDLDPKLDCPAALAPLIDPNVHSCGTVRPHGAAELAQPEPGLFIAGMKSYGRAPTFLLATGHEQVRSIAAHLAGDREAARRVELELPATGVCSSDLLVAAESGCCGGPAPAETQACCAADATAKAESEPGCGCPPARAALSEA
jgi:hypothetical protein